MFPVLLIHGRRVFHHFSEQKRFYDTVTCEGAPLQGDIIVSGYRGEYVGSRAIDGITRTDTRVRKDKAKVRYPDTFWRSGCGPCSKGQAYIGLDFGWQRRWV